MGICARIAVTDNVVNKQISTPAEAVDLAVEKEDLRLNFVIVAVIEQRRDLAGTSCLRPASQSLSPDALIRVYHSKEQS